MWPGPHQARAGPILPGAPWCWGPARGPQPGSGTLRAGSARCFSPSHLICRPSSRPAHPGSLARGSSPLNCLHGPCFPSLPGEGRCRTLRQPSPGPATSALLMHCLLWEPNVQFLLGELKIHPRLLGVCQGTRPDQGLRVPLSSLMHTSTFHRVIS